MSEVSFCRKVSFRALHHYQVPTWDEVRNREFFGDAALAHEHHWSLTLWLQGPVHPDTGMIVDLRQVDKALRLEVLGRFQDKHFQDVDVYFLEHQPTTEVLVQYFAEKLQPHFPGLRLARLRIAERDDIFAEWTP